MLKLNRFLTFCGLFFLSSTANAFDFANMKSSFGVLASKAWDICRGINEIVVAVDPTPYPAFQKAFELCQQISGLGSDNNSDSFGNSHRHRRGKNKGGDLMSREEEYVSDNSDTRVDNSDDGSDTPDDGSATPDDGSDTPDGE